MVVCTLKGQTIDRKNSLADMWQKKIAVERKSGEMVMVRCTCKAK